MLLKGSFQTTRVPKENKLFQITENDIVEMPRPSQYPKPRHCVS